MNYSIGDKKKVQLNGVIYEGVVVAKGVLRVEDRGVELFFKLNDDFKVIGRLSREEYLAELEAEKAAAAATAPAPAENIPHEVGEVNIPAQHSYTPDSAPVSMGEVPQETGEVNIPAQHQYAPTPDPAPAPGPAPVNPVQYAPSEAPADNGKGSKKKKVAPKKKMDKNIPAVKKTGGGKKTIVLLAYVIAIALCLATAANIINSQAEEVAVIRLKTNKLSGDLITEDDIESFKMLKKTYEELSSVTYVTDGEKIEKKPMLLWKDKDKIFGDGSSEDIPPVFASTYIQAGQCLTAAHLTTQKIVRNPWLASVPEGYEIYTLPFDSGDVNTRLLVPGTHLRVRIVVTADVQEAGKGGSNTLVLDDTTGGPEQSVPQSNINTQESTVGKDVTIEVDTTAEEVIGTNEASTNAMLIAGKNVELPLASVVFDKLVAVDMLNASNESIFEIYMALLKLPIEERMAHVETTVEGDVTSFQKKVTPTALVLALTREQADKMAQFENLGNATIKYTILPQRDENNDTYNAFVEINDYINTALEAAIKAQQGG